MSVCPHCGYELPEGVLTPIEVRVAALAAEGYGSTEIAEEVGTSVQTVKNQLGMVYRELDVPRNDLARIKLAVWWNCELFQIGLKELGLVRRAA